MNAKEAFKIDTEYCVEEDGGLYYIMGVETGFAYECFLQKECAAEICEEMNLRKHNR